MSTITVESSRTRVRQTATHTAVASLSAGLAVMITLQLSGGGSRNGAPVSRSDAALCSALANATPASPAALRLADETASRGGC